MNNLQEAPNDPSHDIDYKIREIFEYNQELLHVNQVLTSARDG